jgi:hypothetical protein
MLPGEVVTLTYQAKIGASVTAGTYPDTAFASGCGIVPDGDCPGSDTVYSNLSTVDTPFVGTKVTLAAAVVKPAVKTLLVNTGIPLIEYLLSAMALMGTAVFITRWNGSTKGGRQ